VVRDEIAEADDLVQSALRLAREHLGMPVAFVSQVAEERRVLRFVDADGAPPVEPGDTVPAVESYCHYVLSGELPELLRDPAVHPVTALLSATRELPVGTHLSVPLELSDGTRYGTFCCFGSEVRDDLDERDLEPLRVLAAIVSRHVEAAELRRLQREQRRTRLRMVTVGQDLELELAFQPIVHLVTGEVVGFEALSRFPELENEVPRVFEDAWQLGVGMDLELRAVEAALQELQHLPSTAYLSLNVAPVTLMSPKFDELIRATIDPGRVVVEITEHDAVDDYRELVAAVEQLTATGARLAIDDVGTGFSGLDHILRLDPHILKVDGALVAGVDASPAKQAMITALMTFAARVETRVVAERVETTAEYETLRDLGVDYGQGYLFCRPGILDSVLDASTRTRKLVHAARADGWPSALVVLSGGGAEDDGAEEGIRTPDLPFTRRLL
jgi:EAL domain-containing protein (putative c-di-GMP-specific phosphodiesterase class I)